MLPRLARRAVITLTLLAAAVAGYAQNRPPAPPSPEIDASYARLLDAPLLKKLLADVKADDARTLAELRTITEIEAPPFKEKERAEYMLARFKAPKKVVFGELPKTSTGKIQKFLLRERAKSASAIE